MNPILDLDVSNRAYLFDKTSVRLGLPRFYVEKDFWVVFILHYLFQESPYRSSFLFKGGTCLSKCYDAIHRFSEDVDISINWDLLEYSKEDPLKERTRSQRKKFNDMAREQTGQFVRDVLRPSFEKDLQPLLGPNFSFESDEKDPMTILFHYPSLYSPISIPTSVRIEMGSLSARGARIAQKVSAYCDSDALAGHRPEPFEVFALDPLRIFWEKASILFQVSQRPLSKPIPARYYRHYYDFFQLAHSPYYAAALKRVDLRDDVLLMDQTFYPNTWMDYNTAKQKFTLLPPPERIPELKADLLAMKDMFYGPVVPIEKVFEQLQLSEKDFASLPLS